MDERRKDYILPFHGFLNLAELTPTQAPSPAPPGLFSIFKAFLYIGTIGFGGGLAILAQIQRFVVEKKGWLAPREFTEAVGVIQALPGVIAVNISCLVGFKIRRWSGSGLAVLGMILPAFLSMLLLSEVYLRFHTVPDLERLFNGMTPAIVGFIAVATYKLARASLKNWTDGALAIFAFVALAVLNLGIVLTVLCAGGAGLLLSRCSSQKSINRECGSLILGLAAGWPFVLVSTGILWVLVSSFLKIGAFTFGGGYVMVPILEGEFVHQLHWLSHREFADSVAMGQITPGPVVITATFVGYKVAGFPGAVLATAAVFLPSFLITSAVSYGYQRFRGNQLIQAFLSGVTPAVAGLLGAAVLSMGRNSIQNWVGGLIALLTVVVSLRFRVNALLVIVLAAVVGWLTG